MEQSVLRVTVNMEVVGITGGRIPGAEQGFHRPEADELVHIDQLRQHVQHLLIWQRQSFCNGLQIASVVFLFVGLLLESLAQPGTKIGGLRLILIALIVAERTGQERLFKRLYIGKHAECFAVHGYPGVVASWRRNAGFTELVIRHALPGIGRILAIVVQGHP